MSKVLSYFCILLLLTSMVFGSYESAYQKYLKGDISGAVSEISKDIFSGVKDYRSHLLMIKIYKENLKDYKQATEYAIEGIRLFPDKEKEFSLELGELYWLSGKYDKAEQILLTYNNKYPGDAKCLSLIGKNYFSQNKYYKVVASLESALSYGDKSIETYEYLGKAYRKIGNYNKALETLSYVYNLTKKEEILGIIIEISSIIDVDYTPYLSRKYVVQPQKQVSKSSFQRLQSVATQPSTTTSETKVSPTAETTPEPHETHKENTTNTQENDMDHQSEDTSIQQGE